MVTLETGGAQQDGKRREIHLPFLICDSKLDKPVNDLSLDLFRTRVRIPPGPPYYHIRVAQPLGRVHNLL